MIHAKKFVVVFLLGCVPLFAQTVEVARESHRVDGISAEGFYVEIETSEDDLRDAFTKFLKQYGKPKESDGAWVLAEPVVNGATYNQPLYGKVSAKGKYAAAWMGISNTAWGNDAERMEKEIEKMIKEFGVGFHRGKIQKEIDESTQALTAVERQQQRLVNQNKELLLRLENNQRENLQLQKALEANKLELEIIKMKIDLNKKSQDSVALANEKIRKVIESQKERQRRVN